MKNEEIKDGADTKGKDVELYYDLNLEKDDKIDKEIEDGDNTSSKEDTIDQKIEKSGEEIKDHDDMEEHVAEHHDNDTNNKMDQDGIDIHGMSEPVQFSDDELLPMVTADPMSHAPTADLDIVSIDTFMEWFCVASVESVSEFSVTGTIKASPTVSHGFIDLVVVLDVSGRMHGSKLALLKSAIVFFIDNLSPSYRLSIWLHQYCGSFGEKGVRVLEERLHRDPVSGIMLFSDGMDTCYHCAVYVPGPGQRPQYLHLLPASIYPRNLGMEDLGQEKIFPVYTFCLGADRYPLSMLAISLASGGAIYFIESHEMVEAIFLGCTGALLGVVAQELELIVSVEEEESVLINLSVPVFRSVEGKENGSRTTHLLDIGFSYTEVMSNDMAQIDADRVIIRRPVSPSLFDRRVCLEFDEARNRLSTVQAMIQAQQMAKRGDFAGACFLLSNRRSTLLSSASWQVGPSWFLRMRETEMKKWKKF
ncbi:E3 ubiquitin-protein ligase WAVH1-like [Primulina huaijiensis]|uniref:E3 ubiquitin-protein ligase WAVH1-like n=1 Tax=Primulina huaijiensis TaxID=1492673 RepID=UPI003CC754C1